MKIHYNILVCRILIIIINYGLKHFAKEKAKQQAHGLIKRFGWLVQMSYYGL